MLVTTQISGAYVVVVADSGETYIEARKAKLIANGREVGFSNIELVRSGQVRQYISASNEEAPGIIVQLMRNKFWPLNDRPVSEYEAERRKNAYQRAA